MCVCVFAHVVCDYISKSADWRVCTNPLWHSQMPLAHNRLRECCNVYKQGDLYLLSEATYHKRGNPQILLGCE